MKENLQQLVKHIQSPLVVMDTYSQSKQPNYTHNELDYIQSFLNLSPSFQRPLSDKDFPYSNTPYNDENAQEIDFKSSQHHEEYKNFEKSLISELEPTHQFFCGPNATSLNFMKEELDQNSTARIKDEIKTFPSFIFRSFSKHFLEYEHLYSQKDGISDLKKYLEDSLGAKHHTLSQLQNLFKCSTLWNCKLNRVVLSCILGHHSYREIFTNPQRKKKKTYLIMTKVFKLRCKSMHLCSRVQCQ